MSEEIMEKRTVSSLKVENYSSIRFEGGFDPELLSI
jgi:hypothetical protein